MGFMLSAAFLIVRLICYAALAAVLFAILSMVLLLETGACSSISTGGVSCSAPHFKEIAGWSLGILLLSTFTGIPALFALGGVFFLLRKFYLWLINRTVRPGWPVQFAKALGVLAAIALMLGVVGAFVGGG